MKQFPPHSNTLGYIEASKILNIDPETIQNYSVKHVIFHSFTKKKTLEGTALPDHNIDNKRFFTKDEFKTLAYSIFS